MSLLKGVFLHYFYETVYQEERIDVSLHFYGRKQDSVTKLHFILEDW